MSVNATWPGPAQPSAAEYVALQVECHGLELAVRELTRQRDVALAERDTARAERDRALEHSYQQADVIAAYAKADVARDRVMPQPREGR